MSEEKDFNIHTGNETNLNYFKTFFSGHDKNTIDRYFRIAAKKDSMMVVRRNAAQRAFMQIFIIPYVSSEAEIIAAIKRRSSTNDSFLKSIPIDSKEVLVFGKLLSESEDEIFKKPFERVKKK
jgi:hypothetical protein